MPEIEAAAFVESRIDRVLTQYRESARLLALLRHGLDQRANAALAVMDIPEHFDIRDARGDQLTIIGKWLGFPRCHCVCVTPPLFGFPCPDGEGDPNVTIVGLCEGGVFDGCFASGTGEICLDDDEVYRAFLMARVYQTVGRYQLEDLEAAARIIWGATAVVYVHRPGAVCIAPGRLLTPAESAQVPVAFRVLPVAAGIQTFIHLGVRPLLGFGEGWATLCDEADFLCPIRVDPYTCN